MEKVLGKALFDSGVGHTKPKVFVCRHQSNAQRHGAGMKRNSSNQNYSSNNISNNSSNNSNNSNTNATNRNHENEDPITAYERNERDISILSASSGTSTNATMLKCTFSKI